MVVSPVGWMRHSHRMAISRAGSQEGSRLAAPRGGGYNAPPSARGFRPHRRRFPKGLETMAIERTFSIIKPDATERNLTGAVNAMIEQAGLRVIAQKRVRITRDQAEAFYAVHKARPFFGELVDFMISGPVVVQVLEGEGAIAKYRDIMGATDPSKAAANTIRKVHARSIGENSVHGSDAPDTAAKEIAQFFSGNEIVG
jgi:nucleoside-diphosphate kinase